MRRNNRRWFDCVGSAGQQMRKLRISIVDSLLHQKVRTAVHRGGHGQLLSMLTHVYFVVNQLDVTTGV